MSAGQGKGQGKRRGGDKGRPDAPARRRASTDMTSAGVWLPREVLDDLRAEHARLGVSIGELVSYYWWVARGLADAAPASDAEIAAWVRGLAHQLASTRGVAEWVATWRGEARARQLGQPSARAAGDGDGDGDGAGDKSRLTASSF